MATVTQNPFDPNCESAKHPITEMFRTAAKDRTVAAVLYELVQDHFRLIGKSKLRKAGEPNRLQIDEVAGEGFLRLLASNPAAWNDRTHIVCTAAVAMNQIVLGHVRKERLRAGHESTVSVIDIPDPDTFESDTDDELSDSLERLRQRDAEMVEIVILKTDDRLTSAAVAERLQLTVDQVEYRYLRAIEWLRGDMKRSREG